MTTENAMMNARANFLTLGSLQGIGRNIGMEAMPNQKTFMNDPINRAFAEITLARLKFEVYDLSPAIIVDANTFTIVPYKPPDDMHNQKSWLGVMSELIAKQPARVLMVFHDTVMMLGGPEETQAALKKFEKEVNRHTCPNPVEWLCNNGGVKVNIGSLVTIDGIVSQICFTHKSVMPYRGVRNFNELQVVCKDVTTHLIDKHMLWLEDLARSENIDDIVGYIHKHIEKGFLWFDQMHSGPLMEVTNHLGFGDKSEIQESIGNAIIRTVTNLESN